MNDIGTSKKIPIKQDDLCSWSKCVKNLDKIFKYDGRHFVIVILIEAMLLKISNKKNNLLRALSSNDSDWKLKKKGQTNRAVELNQIGSELE